MVSTNTKIYIANLGKYNEGELVGAWIELPFDDDELHELFCKIQLGKMVNGEYEHGLQVGDSFYEEFAIHDYESFLSGLKIGEYDNIQELNEQILEIEKLHDSEYDLLRAAIEKGDDIEYVLKYMEYYSLYPEIESDEDYGYYLAEENGLLNKLKEYKADYYFDFNEYGESFSMNEDSCYTSYGYLRYDN